MKARNNVRPILLSLLLVVTLVSMVSLLDQSSDADDDGYLDFESSLLEGATTIEAIGTCGSIDWSYSYTGTTKATLVLEGSGTIPAADSSRWVVEYLEVDGIVVTGVVFSDLVDVTYSVDLILDTSVTGYSNAMSSLNPGSLSFSGTNGKIGEQVFSNCRRLTTIDLRGISEVSSGAFKGCAVTSVTITDTILDPTCFEGCTSLKTFIVPKDSTRYTVGGDGQYLLTDSGKTLFMCANGYVGVKGIATDIPSTITTVNLGYADVVLAIDLIKQVTDKEPFVVFNNSVENPITVGFAYSSLGFANNPTITKTRNGVDLTYEVNRGWTVSERNAKIVGNDVSATYGNGKVSLSFDRWCTYLPMGVVNLTYAQLSMMDEVEGWIVDTSGLPDRHDDATVGNLDTPVSLTIRGYNGKDGVATLSEYLYFCGITCHVEKVQAKGGQMSSLKELVIGHGVEIGAESFSNCPNLVSVTGNDVESIGDYAFQYCVRLKSVEFPNCTYFGNFAFGFCVELEEIVLGSHVVEFDPTALEGCMALKMIKVGMDDVVTGVKDITILHYDVDSNTVIDLECIGNYLYIVSNYGKYVEYYTESGDVQIGLFHYTSDIQIHVTLIPMAHGDFYIEVTQGPVDESARSYMVVFNPGLGMDSHEQFYSINGDEKIKDVWIPSARGYNFVGWQYDGHYYDFDIPVSSSMVLTAVWSRANAIDSTPFYLMVIFLVSIVATFVLVGITAKIR